MPANLPATRIGSIRPSRNVFDLSYNKLGTCHFGELIPTMCDEVVPGDTIKIGADCILRFQPMMAPILHEVNATIHYFFVPYRLLTKWYYSNGLRNSLFDWEAFISGGLDGLYNIPLPRWNPTAEDLDPEFPMKSKYQRLWNLFGFPSQKYLATALNPDVTPISFPWWAYNLIYFEYYRDQDLQIDPNLGGGSVTTQNPHWEYGYTWYRNWTKDYFTAARPWQQRGPVPAFPIRGNAPVGITVNDNFLNLQFALNSPLTGNLDSPHLSGIPGFTNSNVSMVANLVTAPTFNVSDLRTIVQLQKWAERNARGGVRYTEFLRNHFGVSPSDSRLDRPEYIGGLRTKLIVSEVLQTSHSIPNAPQANMAGHGLSASSAYIGSYHVEEFGLIMGLLSVMPKATYQQGINRQWLRYSKFDFYFPEFAHLSEQAVYRAEIFWQNQTATDGSHFLGNSRDSQVFGFNGHYDEMRVKYDMVVGELRDTGGSPDLSYWHLGRFFANEPLLNASFINFYQYENWKRAFAVLDRRPVIFHVGNNIKAIRPMPLIAEPGLVDHF